MRARTSWAMLVSVADGERRDEPDNRPIRIDPKSDLARRISTRQEKPAVVRLRNAG